MASCCRWVSWSEFVVGRFQLVSGADKNGNAMVKSSGVGKFAALGNLGHLVGVGSPEPTGAQRHSYFFGDTVYEVDYLAVTISSVEG